MNLLQDSLTDQFYAHRIEGTIAREKNTENYQKLKDLEYKIERLIEQNRTQAKQINFLFERQQSIVEAIKYDR